MHLQFTFLSRRSTSSLFDSWNWAGFFRLRHFDWRLRTFIMESIIQLITAYLIRLETGELFDFFELGLAFYVPCATGSNTNQLLDEPS